MYIRNGITEEPDWYDLTSFEIEFYSNTCVIRQEFISEAAGNPKYEMTAE